MDTQRLSTSDWLLGSQPRFTRTGDDEATLVHLVSSPLAPPLYSRLVQLPVPFTQAKLGAAVEVQPNAPTAVVAHAVSPGPSSTFAVLGGSSQLESADHTLFLVPGVQPAKTGLAPLVIDDPPAPLFVANTRPSGRRWLGSLATKGGEAELLVHDVDDTTVHSTVSLICGPANMVAAALQDERLLVATSGSHLGGSCVGEARRLRIVRYHYGAQGAFDQIQPNHIAQIVFVPGPPHAVVWRETDGTVRMLEVDSNGEPLATPTVLMTNAGPIAATAHEGVVVGHIRQGVTSMLELVHSSNPGIVYHESALPTEIASATELALIGVDSGVIAAWTAQTDELVIDTSVYVSRLACGGPE